MRKMLLLGANPFDYLDKNIIFIIFGILFIYAIFWNIKYASKVNKHDDNNDAHEHFVREEARKSVTPQNQGGYVPDHHHDSNNQF